jgi:hypothetical protein
MVSHALVGSHGANFRSTVQLVQSLRHYGAISAQDFDNAMAYLKPLDQGWADDLNLPRGSTLYVDDLSINYLQHLRLLKPLREAGFRMVIHPSVQEEAAAFDRLAI